MRILRPVGGEAVRAGDRVLLTGAAFDDAHRELGGRALTWYAGRRLLGHGRRLRAALPAGRVVLRLVATAGRRSTTAGAGERDGRGPDAARRRAARADDGRTRSRRGRPRAVRGRARAARATTSTAARVALRPVAGRRAAGDGADPPRRAPGGLDAAACRGAADADGRAARRSLLRRIDYAQRVRRGARSVSVRIAVSAPATLAAAGRSYRVGPAARRIAVPLPARPAAGLARGAVQGRDRARDDRRDPRLSDHDE